MTPSQLTPVSNTEMQEAVRQALAQGSTGQAEVTFALGDRATLLVQAGQVHEILWVERTRQKRLPGSGWADLFASPQMGVVTWQPANGRFLNLERACFEVAAQETRSKLPNAELEKLFAAYRAHESATVFALQWQSARGYVLMPGANLGLMRAVFIEGAQVENDDMALSSMTYWRDPTCEVKIFQNGLENPLWIGLHLNILFEYFASHLLTQYGFLTGRVMVSSMVRNVVYAATQINCDMLNVSNRLQDHTLFGSLDETNQAYKDMLALMEQQMESVVGSNFVAVVKDQAFDSLNPFYIGLARYYGLAA